MTTDELIRKITNKKATLLVLITENDKICAETKDLEEEINKLIKELNEKHEPNEKDITEVIVTRKGDWIKT